MLYPQMFVLSGVDFDSNNNRTKRNPMHMTSVEEKIRRTDGRMISKWSLKWKDFRTETLTREQSQWAWCLDCTFYI
jgi:hypothetical protein